MGAVNSILWRFFLIVFSCFLVLACGTGINDSVLESFPGCVVDISPSSEFDMEDKGILAPSKIFKYGEELIIGIDQSDHLVDIYNTKSERVISCAYVGRGAGEMTSNTHMSVLDQYIYLYDYNLGNFWRIDVEKTIATGKPETELFAKLNQIRRKDVVSIPIFVQNTHNGAISTGLLGGHKWYCLLDDNFEELSFVEDCDFDNFKDLSDLARNNVHVSSHISISPDEKKVVCALQPAAAISISEIDGPNLREYFRRTFYSCDVRDTPNGPRFNPDDKEAFRDASSDSDNIYLLYSGQTYHQEIPAEESSYVIVFDWSGNLKKVFHLTERIRSMCLDGNTLYGVTQYPESKVLVYSI